MQTLKIAQTIKSKLSMFILFECVFFFGFVVASNVNLKCECVCDSLNQKQNALMEAYVNQKPEKLDAIERKILEDIQKDQTLVDNFVMQCYDPKSMYICLCICLFF